jgi:Putative transposase
MSLMLKVRINWRGISPGCLRFTLLQSAGASPIAGDALLPEETASILKVSKAPPIHAAGFSLHGNVAISSGDRLRLERLVRYAARPPLSMERLEELPDGKLRYWFKTPWRNGMTYADFEPLEFIERIAALIPTPRIHMVRFHGLLGPAAKWRPCVIPNAAVAIEQAEPPNTGGPTAWDAVDSGPTGKQEAPDTPKPQGRNYTWSELMKRVFAADVLACAHCGGRLHILSTIRPPEITRKILEHLGLPSRPPPVAAALPQELPFE